MCESATKENNDFSLNTLLVHIMRLHFLRCYKSLDKWGIHPGQVPLLSELERNNGLSQKELSDRLRVRPSTITVMIRRMEANGLVERQHDPNDQRVSHVVITASGRQAHEQIVKAMDDVERECFRHFSAEEIMLMKRLLMQMRDNLAVSCDREGKDGEDTHA